MTRAAKSFGAVVAGVVFIVAGVYGWLGEVSVLLAGVGLVVLLVGAGALLSTQSRARLRAPQPIVYGLLALAIALHVYQNLRMIAADFSYGWFLWALVPYGLVLILSCFEGTRFASIAAAALALVADVYTYYAVAQSSSSTASLAFLWMPLWNTIIVVPAATFLAWLLLRRREPVSPNAP